MCSSANRAATDRADRPAAQQNAANFEAFGQIMWLWSFSQLHNTWPIADAVHYILPAISQRQFLLLKDAGGMPRAYASWAYLSLEAELRYIKKPSSIAPADWTSGERLWFMDFIAPFGFADVLALRRELGRIHGKSGASFFARSIRVKPGRPTATIREHTAGSQDLARTRELAEQYFAEIAQYLHAAARSRG